MTNDERNPKAEGNPKAPPASDFGAASEIRKSGKRRGGEAVRLKLSVMRRGSSESGRGQPHSKTCRRYARLRKCAKRLGVRLPSAAFVRLTLPDGFNRTRL